MEKEVSMMIPEKQKVFFMSITLHIHPTSLPNVNACFEISVRQTPQVSFQSLLFSVHLILILN